MPDYKPVPVEAARKIAVKFDKSMVVILAYDPAHQLTHTTTYGVSAIEKEQAAAAGELLARTIGADLNQKTEFEDFHKDYDPARYRQCQEALAGVDHALGSLLAVREGISNELLSKLRERVKACLQPVLPSASSAVKDPQ